MLRFPSLETHRVPGDVLDTADTAVRKNKLLALIRVILHCVWRGMGKEIKK